MSVLLFFFSRRLKNFTGKQRIRCVLLMLPPGVTAVLLPRLHISFNIIIITLCPLCPEPTAQSTSPSSSLCCGRLESSSVKVIRPDAEHLTQRPSQSVSLRTCLCCRSVFSLRFALFIRTLPVLQRVFTVGTRTVRSSSTCPPPVHLSSHVQYSNFIDPDVKFTHEVE